MMYLSTDYVFNGLGVQSWDADCKDYEPFNVYGIIKLLGKYSGSKVKCPFNSKMFGKDS